MLLLLTEILPGVALIVAVVILYGEHYREVAKRKKLQDRMNNLEPLVRVIAESIIRSGRWDRESDEIQAWLARPKNGTDT